MVCYTRVPYRPLSKFIAEFWYYDGSSSPRIKERVLPHGSAELVIGLDGSGMRVFDDAGGTHGQEACAGVVSGPYAQPFLTETAAGASLIGIYFRPGGASPFLGIPTGEIGQATVPLRSLWGNRLDHLREELVQTKEPEDKFAILEHLLLKHATPRLAPRPAVRFALRQLTHAPAVRKVSEVTGQTGLRPGPFIERFREEVGLTPKRYARVQRFQHALRIIDRRQEALSWLDVALRAGYFDQAHFIHEFRTLAGQSPTDYLRYRGPVPNRQMVRD